MTASMLEWKTNEALAVGKGATIQQFVATVGNDRLEIEVAPWGEGHFKVNDREIAHINDTKDRRASGLQGNQNNRRTLRGDTHV